jgi:hypothetical protein
VVQHFRREAPNIHELDLRVNRLSDLPVEISQLTSLHTVRLNYNHFAKIPHTLANLPTLITLDISNNFVSSVDSSIGLLTFLQYMDLSGNAITQLDPAISHLSSVTHLVLANNNLQALPESIGEMPSLSKLDVSSNALERLPDSLGQSKALRVLNAKHNKLRSLPLSLGHVKTLQRLEVDGNPLEHSIAQHVESGSVRLLKILREQEEYRKQEELERLQPLGHQAGSWLEYAIKYTFSDADEDPRCPCRPGASITVCEGRIIIFGGLIDGKPTQETHYVNLAQLHWLRAKPLTQNSVNEPPGPRNGHIAAFDETYCRMLIFGGRSPERRVNEMYALDLTTLSWARIEQDGTKPEARELATGVVWGRIWVVFGGRGNSGRLNDIHFFDFDSNTWTQPLLSGEAPAPRQSAASSLRDDVMYVHGGRNGSFAFGDVFKLNLGSQMWESIETDGVSPGACYSHEMTAFKNELWAFGGYDGDGNERTSLHRLDLIRAGTRTITDLGEPELNRASWIEHECELEPNGCRLAIFRGNMLQLIQRGSHSAAISETDEANRSKLWYWNCFKSVEVNRLKEKDLPHEVLYPASPKRKRVEHTMKEQLASMPLTAKVQLRNERAIIDHFERFRWNFIELYPNRNPHMLCPQNECGVRKPLCSTLRPTELPFAELYDEDAIAQLVSEYVEYEELEEPISYPETIPSPWSVLQWQAGDCFDLAILLCSLLLGVGYDAYVVSGYAPKRVTRNDQTRERCPYFEAEKRLNAKTEETPESDRQRILRTTKYTIRRKRAGEEQVEKEREQEQQQEQSEIEGISQQQKQVGKDELQKQQQHQEEKVEQQQQQSASGHGGDVSTIGGMHCGWEGTAVDERQKVPVILEDDVEPEHHNIAAEKAVQDDIYGGNRKHAWVCVLQGHRGVTRAHYIEPTTARTYKLAENPYEGVEFVFNCNNLWVNMREDSIRQGHGRMLPELDFNLENLDFWEPVLPVGKDPFLGTGLGWKEQSSKTPMTASVHERSEIGVLSASAHQTSASTSKGAHEDTEASNQQELPGPTNLIFPDGMLTTWVPRVELSRKELDTRCPRGAKEIKYYKAKYQIFATFGERARWDGLTERVMLYNDEARSRLKRCVEHYARRRDRKQRRESFPQEDTVIEQFSPGSSYNMKELRTMGNATRYMSFHLASRMDGLLSREDIYLPPTNSGVVEGLRSMTECYTGRDDLLEKRKVRYTSRSQAGQRIVADMQDRRRRQDEAKQPIMEIVDCFALDKSHGAPSPEEQVASKAYQLSRDSIRVEYHFGRGRITAPVRIFGKDGSHETYSLQEFERKPSSFDLEEHLNKLVSAEQEVVFSVRESEEEEREVSKTRQNEELSITLTTPYYDITRAEGEEAESVQDEGNPETQKSRDWNDLLAPFVPEDAHKRELTVAEAEKVRDQARQTLKDHLSEQANIIQTRYNEEADRYHKKQQHFQRDKDQRTQEQEENHERECEEMLFRMHIVQQRLDKHEKEAHERHEQLMRMLEEDPRLKAIQSCR